MSPVFRMPSSDAVSRRCIVKKDGCNLLNKCDECKKEIKDLVEIDEMFIDYFKQVEYLKKRELAKQEKNVS
jgi:hypothetical protein